MPQRPLRPCEYPRCPNLSRRKFCPTHTVTREQSRAKEQAKPWSHVYRTYRWHQVRRIVLTAQPNCDECGAEANTVDHIIPLRELWTPYGWKMDPYNLANLRSLCASCSGKRTAGWRKP